MGSTPEVTPGADLSRRLSAAGRQVGVYGDFCANATAQVKRFWRRAAYSRRDMSTMCPSGGRQISDRVAGAGDFCRRCRRRMVPRRSVDTRCRQAHDSNMVRRLPAAIVIAFMLASRVAALDCAGWVPSSNDRMACCVKADHECPDQLAADRCCAAGELAKQAGVVSACATALVPTVTVAAVPPLFVAPSLVRVFRSLSNSPQSPPHLRRTVLLI
jgi:hypothetical protein